MSRDVCQSCRHPAHLGLCTARSGDTAYACMCSTTTLPSDHRRPTDDQLREAARHTYGTSCSLIHCKASRGVSSGGERDLYLPDDLRVERDADNEGTWITARLWISDGAFEGKE